MMTPTPALADPHQQRALGMAHIEITSDRIVASTGRVQRVWQRVAEGVQTTSFLHIPSQTQWIAGPNFSCDWSLHGLVADPASVRFIGATVEVCEGVMYTADHLAVTLTYSYDTPGFDLQYRVWVYPDAPGLRTQLAIRSQRVFDPAELPAYLGNTRSERLAVDPAGKRRRAVGYYSDTQHRNYGHTPIRETRSWEAEAAPRHGVEWANLLCLEQGDAGLALVKESHKCVTQTGVDTGAFLVSPAGLEVTGLGLTPNHYERGFWADCVDHWRSCWATWSLAYDAAEAGDLVTASQLAVKRMDRCRHPFRPERDRLIMSNTWGSGGAGEGSRAAAEHANVVREIDSAADLGIDIVQIDDGWQAAPGEHEPIQGNRDWRPSPERWPEGWETIRRYAEAAGVELGLWFPWYIDLDKIVWNIESGGFRRVKLDFMHLFNVQRIEDIQAKAAALAQRFGPRLGINWDITEVNPRLGYFFGRDHGNLYLENRENGPPPLNHLNHIRYTPRLVLRDAWQLAHEINLNQIQLSIQNKDLVVCDVSDADRYPHDYAFAITMMGLPIFMQETRYYDEDARAALRPLVSLYKTHRDAILEGYVFPLGDEPDGSAWTGFQSCVPGASAGYVTLFRELGNAARQRDVRLHLLGDADTLAVTDLVTGQVWDAPVLDHGNVSFELDHAPSYRFFRYETR